MERIAVRVHRRTEAAKDIVHLDLRPQDGGTLPPFEPGAHVDLFLANGLIRQYSLLGDPDDLTHYEVAVSRAPCGRGGSAFVHEALLEGAALEIGPPRNNFTLKPGAKRYVLIAGGIGITPILAMARHCQKNGLDWRLLYLARSRAHAAFCDALAALDPRKLQFHFDDEQGCFFDFSAEALQVEEGSAIYCCGPDPVMQCVARFAQTQPGVTAHFEWFSPPAEPQAHAPDMAFTVKLAASGASFEVPEGRSILEVLEANGYEMSCSCREGMCRTCETAVLEGAPDHRDYVLSAEEREQGRSIMICVSRSQTPILVLDI
jgi:vanillate O-demethylase ferredoxin subunit